MQGFFSFTNQACDTLRQTVYRHFVKITLDIPLTGGTLVARPKEIERALIEHSRLNSLHSVISFQNLPAKRN